MNKSQRIIIVALIIAGLITTMTPIITSFSQAQNNTGNDTFSIIQISDTQFLSASYPGLFNDTANWIVANSAAYNVKMVVHTGDIVDNINGTTRTSSNPNQWQSANNSMGILLNAGIPYCWDAGNHDQIPWNDPNGSWLGSSYSAFNATNMHSKLYWVSDAVDSKNTAVKFAYNGYNFLIINLEYMANNTTITWMKNLIDNNKGANVIVAAHTYLNKGGTYGVSSPGLPGEVAWCNNFRSILDGYSNVFLTLSGHDPTGTANMTRVGNREEIFFDRQGVNNQTGAASVRIYTFNVTNMQVNAATFAVDKQTWLTDAYNQFCFNASLNSGNYYQWTLKNDGQLVKGYPALREYIWQKNATMPPNGQYDKIGLHRLVNTAIPPKGVILMLPGTYGSGEWLTSNPPTDNFTLSENESQALYWANRGFDVNAMDYRTHFVPDSLNPLPPDSINSSQLSFMANWGWDQWMSDINEAVGKVQAVSGTSRIFMAGQSFGGRATMNYATVYPQNLRGIILLDGGNASANTAPSNTYNLTAALAQENITQSWYLITPTLPGSTPVSSTFKYLAQYALANPGAPAFNPFTNTTFGPPVNPLTGKAFANITEAFGYIMQTAAMTNITGGYLSSTTLVRVFANEDMFWPDRLNLEYNAYMGWNSCPYLTKDFDDNFKNVNVPLYGFTSQMYGLPRSGLVGNISNPDVTRTLLTSYGHLDVFEGIYSARDVSEPSYQWLLNHILRVSVTSSAPTIVVGYTATLSVSVTGGPSPYTYQWYEGNTILQGQTGQQLTVSKNTPGTYTYTCSVTDSYGTTANSTAITVNVTAPSPTPTPTPTQTTQPKPSITTTPTPAPTSTPTVMTTPTAIPTNVTQPENANTTVYIAIAIAAIAVAIIASAALLIKRKQK